MITHTKVCGKRSLVLSRIPSVLQVHVHPAGSYFPLSMYIHVLIVNATLPIRFLSFSVCSQLFNFTFASCMYITCQRKKRRDHRGSTTSVEDMEIEELKTSLQFHFMNPFQKWRFAKRRRFPWKLFVQILNIILVTLQVHLKWN